MMVPFASLSESHNAITTTLPTHHAFSSPKCLSRETAAIIVDDPLLPTNHQFSESNTSADIRKIDSSGDFTQLTSSTEDSDGSTIDSSDEAIRRDSASSVSSDLLALATLEDTEDLISTHEDASSSSSSCNESKETPVNEAIKAPLPSRLQSQEPEVEVEEDPEAQPSQPPRRSVRFSQVHTRLYPVIFHDPVPSPHPTLSSSFDSSGEHDHDPSLTDNGPLRTLDWEHTETLTADIDAHLDQVEKERKERYAEMIFDHNRRVESRREEEERKRKEKEREEKKGMRGNWRRWKKGLRKFGKGLWKACGRTAMMVPSPSYGGY